MLVEKPLLQLSNLLNSGEVSSIDIANAYIEKIHNVDCKINAYITFDENRLLKEAFESDKRRAKGKTLSEFDGIPVAIKDNICTKGLKTTCASGMLRDFVPPYDATAYVKMRQKGFITLGKTNMDEFAMGSSTETSFFGPTCNPYDLERVPGGSSGGSAAAVAASMTPAALGSDTGGSIRQPASFCGVVGIKPTYGRVSRYGLIAFASSFDQIGTFARNVSDAAALLSVISGNDSRDATSIERGIDFSSENLTGDVKDMVIGIPEDYFKDASADIKDAIFNKIKKIEAMGAKIERIYLHFIDYIIPIFYLIASAEASSNLARYDGIRYGYRSSNISRLIETYKKSRSEGFGMEVKRRIIIGTFSLSSGYYDAYYLKAQKGRSLIIEDYKKAFSRVDAIITPITLTPAFKLGEKLDNPIDMYFSDLLTVSANLAAIPGISVPIGNDREGMPIGLQILSNHFQEKTLCNLAKAIENTCEVSYPVI